MQIPMAQQQPTYDPAAVQPMRDELTSAGFEELRRQCQTRRNPGFTAWHYS